MNIAVIFAGGIGKRMGKTEKPKQFLELCGKPIIIHTIEKFENSNKIDGIVVVCVKEWIDYLENLLIDYNIKKVVKIVEGGSTGQMSIFNGLKWVNGNYSKDTIVLIHDGVRPFIDDELITNCIENVIKCGSAISCVPSTETVVLIDNQSIEDIPDRNKCVVAKAPQCFVINSIYNVHLKAQEENFVDAIDSASLMNKYGVQLSVIMTDYDNIKITTPKDIYIAESIYHRRFE